MTTPPWEHSTATPYIIPAPTGGFAGTQAQWPTDGGKLPGTSGAFKNGIPYPLQDQFLHDDINVQNFVDHYNRVLQLLAEHTHEDYQERIDTIARSLEDYADRIAAQRSLKFCKLSTSQVRNVAHNKPNAVFGFTGRSLVEGDPSNPNYPVGCRGSNTIIYVTGSTADLEKPSFCQWDSVNNMFRIIELYVEAVEARAAARIRTDIVYNVTYITYQRED
jgi:hypothetical protein